MNTIAKVQEFLQLLSEEVGIQRKKQFEFGFQSISIQPLMSLNGNARVTDEKRKTAETKIYRILHNEHFLEEIPVMVTYLGFVNEGYYINVDFSDFGDGRQVLMFAKQTKTGRALPVYFEELQYPIQKGSQNIFIVEAIERLLKQLKVRVKFVFDRGFASPYIVRDLAKKKTILYVRIKKGKHVVLPNEKKKASEKIRNNDQEVWVYSNELRLVRSDKPSNDNEAWYIITNDTESTREEVIRIYYHRFEIEEFFRDAKHIFRMEYVHLKTALSFSIVLWFVIIGIWLSWYLHIHLAHAKRLMKKRKNGKYPVSIIRFWFEQIQLALRQYFLKQICLKNV